MKHKTLPRPKKVEPKTRGAKRGGFWETAFEALKQVIKSLPPPLPTIFDAIIEWLRRRSRLLRVLFYSTVTLGIVVYWLREPIGKSRLVIEVMEKIVILYESIVPPHIPVATGKHFSVVMTWLDGDSPDKQAFENLCSPLLAFTENNKLRIERRLRLRGNDPLALENAKKTAGAWLAKSKADVIIWGAVDRGGGDIRLYITSRSAPGAKEAVAPAREWNLIVPKGGGGDFSAVIVTQLFAFLAPFNPSQVISPDLAIAIERFRGILQEKPEGAPGANLTFALANAESILGAQQSSEPLVSRAVERYIELLARPHTEGIKYSIAELRNNLGNALWSQGNLTQEIKVARAHWESAAVQYATAAKEYEQGNKPESWAVTQNNRGLTLQSLGFLKEAVEVYQQALTKLSAQVSPPDWAMVQNNLGNALFLMGESDASDNGTAELHEAKQAFEKALAISSGKRQLTQAFTQNNLGNVLSALGERQNSPQGNIYLQDAIAAYERALKEYHPDLKYLARDRAMTRYNRGLAQLVLGQRQKDPSQLAKAIDELQASIAHLEEPLRVRAQRERSLGLALYLCGQIESAPTEIPSRWKEAVEAFRSAILHFGGTFDAAETGNRLGLLLADWANREGTRDAKLARWGEAIKAFEDALRVPKIEDYPDYGNIQNNLWEAQRRQSELRVQATRVYLERRAALQPSLLAIRPTSLARKSVSGMNAVHPGMAHRSVREKRG